jgi:predicted permease
LIVQCLVESLVLASLGGLLGLVFARWGVSIIVSMLPLKTIPPALVFHADARILGFAAGVSLLSALLFGLAPAWRATQVDLTAALKSSHGNTEARGTRRLGRLLVACQVGLSVVLLVAAGLFIRTLRNLTAVDLGFNPENLVQVSIDTRGSGYREGQVVTVYRLLLERVSNIPGVVSATVIRNPVIRGLSRCSSRLPGLTLAPEESWDCVDVGPSFFETMNIPVLRGRTFGDADFVQGRRLSIISQSFAKRYFPNDDPIGRSNIIGIVRDAKLSSLRRENEPLMYLMVPKEPDRISALEVRTAGNPTLVLRAIEAEVQGVNPRLLAGIQTVRQEIDADIATERMVAATSSFFALLGLLLTCVGIFGVASYTVAQRTNELGIRIALGAGRWPVIRESLRDTILVFGVGLAGGTIIAIAAVRLAASLMSDLLFGLTATDAANIGAAVLVMAGVASIACLLPAWRATKIDPLTAIRYE